MSLSVYWLILFKVFLNNRIDHFSPSVDFGLTDEHFWGFPPYVKHKKRVLKFDTFDFFGLFEFMYPVGYEYKYFDRPTGFRLWNDERAGGVRELVFNKIFIGPLNRGG